MIVGLTSDPHVALDATHEWEKRQLHGFDTLVSFSRSGLRSAAARPFGGLTIVNPFIEAGR
jgi:hypothetical protein